MLRVRQVWQCDIELAFEEIRDLAESFPYISINALWCGSVAKPLTKNEYVYNTTKITVDVMKLFQLGLALSDAQGNRPPDGGLYQLNFAFNAAQDCQFEEYVDNLARHGVDFHRAEAEGIDIAHFGELMYSSGLAINPYINWVTYHGANDVGLILKAMTNSYLPEAAADFNQLVADHFPCIYDVRHLCHQMNIQGINGSLRQAYETLGLSSSPSTDEAPVGSAAAASSQPTASPSSATPPLDTIQDCTIRAAVNAEMVNQAFFVVVSRSDYHLLAAQYRGTLYGVNEPLPIPSGTYGSNNNASPTPQAAVPSAQNGQTPAPWRTPSRQPPPAPPRALSPREERLPPGMLRVKPSQIIPHIQSKLTDP